MTPASCRGWEVPDIRKPRKRGPSGKVPQDSQEWVAGQFDSSVTWEDLAWLRSMWSGKIALEGVLDADDARETVAHGGRRGHSFESCRSPTGAGRGVTCSSPRSARSPVLPSERRPGKRPFERMRADGLRSR